MGAGAVSLGSCMDGLRRSPSFIKRTPTCRIDLAKKQGGNSSSSVFPDHKSLGGVPPGGEVTPLSAQQSPRTKEGAGQELSLLWRPQSVQSVNDIHGNIRSKERTAGNIKERMFMMDGQLFKEKHHRVLDGRDPNQDGCDVTRQTGTSFSSCRDVKQGET
ncbi:unnamed protein product [Pleuronectes platessa]|uniref:Uncharacterized protein n=1 Tax=Pleuronectes platessa TaxID=8262 RepID=A0A9N7UVV8_PLEPL|nr:unnamed protein product [Pleuronectes platessa]